VIKTPTTFVIGAGASAPYGLPLGSDLLTQARALKREESLYKLIAMAIPQPSAWDRVGAFLDNLRETPVGSIDGFLEKRQSDPAFMVIGRAVIAALMASALQRKRKKSTPPTDQDWLGEIIARMSAGANNRNDFDSGNSAVRFVTFNFDSIIEERLIHDVGKLYPEWGGAGVTDVVQTIHVHGRLPELPHIDDAIIDFVRTAHGDTNPLWIEWIKRAMTSVNVVMDPIMAEVTDRAKDALRQATVVCFLGFGFHDDNLVKLGIPGSVNTDTYHHVFGSAYKLHEGDQASVLDLFAGQIKLGGFDDTCLRVLQKVYVFRP
jgi:hypothetical protein